MENVEPLREIFDQMFALLEALETQNIAVVQFLRDEGIAADDKLAPYLERAGNASSVKWRAARARMEHLLTPIPSGAKEAAKAAAETHKPEKAAGENKDDGKNDTESKAGEEPKAENVKARAEERESADRGSEREEQNGPKDNKANPKSAAESADGKNAHEHTERQEQKHA